MYLLLQNAVEGENPKTVGLEKSSEFCDLYSRGRCVNEQDISYCECGCSLGAAAIVSLKMLLLANVILRFSIDKSVPQRR